MRKLIYLISLVAPFYSCHRNNTSEDILRLQDGWKFSVYDSIQFSSPQYNEEDWPILRSDTFLKYDQNHRTRWYRVKIIIPSTLYKNSFFKDSIQFSLGSINGYDQTYLNGFPLGYNGKVIEETDLFPGKIEQEGANIKNPRNYKISISDPRVLWNQINILAIRILADSGYIAQPGKSSSISMIDLKDFVSFNVESTAFESGHFYKQIELLNTLNYSLEGRLYITVLDTEQQKIIFNDHQDISIEKKSSFTHLYAFESSKSSNYQITYSFKPNNCINSINKIEYQTWNNKELQE
jgi:alpha-galactosidase